MCETASTCQVDSKQRIHAVRFSETPERIELGDIQSIPCKTNSPIRTASRRGILSKTRLTPSFEEHRKLTTNSTEHQDDCTARSSSAPTTSIALVHKDSIELILKRGISMTSKSTGVGFLSMRSKNHNKEASPTKWKMRFWMPKHKDDYGSDTSPGHSKKGAGFLQLLPESDLLNSSSDTPEISETSFEMSCYSEENNEDDSSIYEEFDSPIDCTDNEVYSQLGIRVDQASVTKDEESEGDEGDSGAPE